MSVTLFLDYTKYGVIPYLIMSWFCLQLIAGSRSYRLSFLDFNTCHIIPTGSTPSKKLVYINAYSNREKAPDCGIIGCSWHYALASSNCRPWTSQNYPRPQVSGFVAVSAAN